MPWPALYGNQKASQEFEQVSLSGVGLYPLGHFSCTCAPASPRE